jgi:hypothetical protein
MTDIQVVAGDLTRLADAVARGATELSIAGPTEQQLFIDSGSADVNQAFADVLYGCRVARDAVRAELEDTAANLQAVREEYERNEWRTRQLFDEMMDIDPLADR